jgi:hypothetical protein
MVAGRDARRLRAGRPRSAYPTITSIEWSEAALSERRTDLRTIVEVPFAGEYDAALLRHADRASRRLLGRSTIDVSSGHLAGIAVVLIIGPLFAVAAGAPRGLITWAPLGVLAGIIAAINSWGIARATSNTELLGQRVEGTISDDGIRLMSSVREIRSRWSAMSQFRCTRASIALTGSMEGALVLPRSFFGSDEQFAQAASLVSRNVKPRRELARWKRWFRVALILLVLLLIFLLWSLFMMTNARPSHSTQQLTRFSARPCSGSERA